jgi:hypothetical protein
VQFGVCFQENGKHEDSNINGVFFRGTPAFSHGWRCAMLSDCRGLGAAFCSAIRGSKNGKNHHRKNSG